MECFLVVTVIVTIGGALIFLLLWCAVTASGGSDQVRISVPAAGNSRWVSAPSRRRTTRQVSAALKTTAEMRVRVYPSGDPQLIGARSWWFS